MIINLAQAARAEAMRLARNQVRLQLRAAGVKLSYIEASQINRLALELRAEEMDRALVSVLAWQRRTRMPVLQRQLLFICQVRNDHRLCKSFDRWPGALEAAAPMA